MDATRMAELRRRQNASDVKKKIAEAIDALDTEQAAEDAQFELEGVEAMKPLRPKALKQLAKDLTSNNEKIRQTAVLKLLEYTDGRPGQRDESDDPTEIVFRTEALPADGTIRYDGDPPPEPDAAPTLAFQL
jgi:hypothetical protein